MIKRLLVHLSLYGRISRFVGPYATSFLRGVTRAPAGADGVHVNTGDDVALMLSAAAAAAAVGTARQSLGETVVERSRLSNDGRRRRRCCSINNSTTTRSADSAALVHPAGPGRDARRLPAALNAGETAVRALVGRRRAAACH